MQKKMFKNWKTHIYHPSDTINSIKRSFIGGHKSKKKPWHKSKKKKKKSPKCRVNPQVEVPLPGFREQGFWGEKLKVSWLFPSPAREI
jgi:hypothetical protein